MRGNGDRVDLLRRTIVGGLGVGAGLWLGRDTTQMPRWLGGTGYDHLSYAEALHQLDLSFSAGQRSATVLPWDHPSRQVTNTLNIHQGPHLGTLFDNRQTALIRRIYTTMLSEQGTQWMQNTTGLEGKFAGSSFKIFSDQPAGALASDTQRTQSMCNGAHYMLRKGGVSQSGYAFGGPIAYGQQLGNNKFKVQGNAFKAHGDAVNEFHAALSARERIASYRIGPPSELVTQPLGSGGIFAGIRIGDTSPAAQQVAEEMMRVIFSAYPESQQGDAAAAIDANGGIKDLHVAFYSDFSFYQDGVRYVDLSAQQRVERALPYAQVWRIEGPNCVVHFQGYPHVHAYINMVSNIERASVGEVLARTIQPITGYGVHRLISDALRTVSGEPLVYLPEVNGRLPGGIVSSGNMYALDPYNNNVVVVDVAGKSMHSSVRASLALQGVAVRSDNSYRVATIDYMLEASHKFGQIEQVIGHGRQLKFALIDFARDRDLASYYA